MVNAALIVGRSKTAKFHWHSDASDGGSVSSRAGLGEVVVPATNLEQALGIHGFGPGAWIVMDIEGAEHDILSHSERVMSQVGGVILEAHDQGPHVAEDAFRLLGGMGFSMLGRRGRVAAFARDHRTGG